MAFDNSAYCLRLYLGGKMKKETLLEIDDKELSESVLTFMFDR